MLARLVLKRPFKGTAYFMKLGRGGGEGKFACIVDIFTLCNTRL